MKCTHPHLYPLCVSWESLGLDVEGGGGGRMKSRCVEFLMKGFLHGIAYILPTTVAPVSSFTFELSLYSTPDPWDLVTIPGWQEALILGESRGSPCHVWDPQCYKDWEEAFPGWVAKIDPLIKKEPLPNSYPKKEIR